MKRPKNCKIDIVGAWPRPVIRCPIIGPVSFSWSFIGLVVSDAEHVEVTWHFEDETGRL